MEYFVVILSKLKIIKSKDKNYITKKQLKLLLKGLGILNKKLYKAIFPFKLFYIGTILNVILEILFFRFNLGIKSYFIFVKNGSNDKKKSSKTLLIPAKNERKFRRVNN